MTSVEAKLRLGQKVFIMFLSKRVRTKPMQTNLLPFLVRNEQKHNILGHYRYEYRTLYFPQLFIEIVLNLEAITMYQQESILSPTFYRKGVKS